MGAGACLLVEEALKDWAGRTVGHEVAFFTAEETAWGATIHLTARRAVERRFLAVILVNVASGSGRQWLSGCSSCCGRSGDSSHSGRRWGRGFLGGDLLICFFEVLFQDPDLVLHGAV